MNKLIELADAYADTAFEDWQCRKEVRAALVAEIERVEPDAARYRWLEVNAYVGIAPHPKPHEVWCCRLPNPRNCANLGAAIDAAIAAAEGSKT